MGERRDVLRAVQPQEGEPAPRGGLDDAVDAPAPARARPLHPAGSAEDPRPLAALPGPIFESRGGRLSSTWTCSRCGEEHAGLPDLSFDAPWHWDGPHGEPDRLTEDLCRWTDADGNPAFFIRGVLHIPLVDGDDTFGYGAWSSLSEQSFERVVDLWTDPARVHEDPYFGWLSNRLPGYPDTLNLPLDVITAELDLRPAFVLHDGEHPIIAAQRQGITVARARELVERDLHPS